MDCANEHLYAALRLCDYTLNEWLRTVIHQAGWDNMVQQMVTQLLQAVQYLHVNGVLHCDLTVSVIDLQLRLGDS